MSKKSFQKKNKRAKFFNLAAKVLKEHAGRGVKVILQELHSPAKLNGRVFWSKGQFTFTGHGMQFAFAPENVATYFLGNLEIVR